MNAFQRLKERFWFVPALLCLVAFVAAEALVALDRRLGRINPPDWVDLVVNQVGERGSRDILGAIASSSLAVAGTTFSITIAVMALTSSAYGPRLVRNFMADRGNQAVLGVFVGTFLYSLLVLRSIRVIGDPGQQDAEVFVPHLAVNGAVLLAVLNVGVLVYFIHHISNSIQISTIAQQVRRDLHQTVARLYPGDVGRGTDDLPDAEGHADLPERLEEESGTVAAGRSGYVQYVRGARLIHLAREHDMLIAMRVRPGEYVIGDTVLAWVHPSARLTDELAERVRHMVVIGGARNPYQDVEFAVQQLTELMVRALSPGTNDPYTAINALDDLSSGLARLAEREAPPPVRYDGEGVARVVAPAPAVVDLVSGVLDGLRWYGRSHPSVMAKGLSLIERVGRRARDGGVCDRLLAELELMREVVETSDHHPHDIAQFRSEAARVERDLRGR